MPHAIHRRLRADERGQVLPLVALLFAVVAGAAVLVVRVGTVLDERARAVTAADAAALAGAAEGREAAERLARDNGARLERFATIGADTTVTVRVGRARATATATRVPTPPPATWMPWPEAPEGGASVAAPSRTLPSVPGAAHDR